MASFSLGNVPHFRPSHIFPLLGGVGMVLGAVLPLTNPPNAIRTFGLPEHIARSGPAQACFTIYGSRAASLGAALFIFYYQGKLKAVDTILSLQAYAGIVDAYVCWKEGVPRKAVARLATGLLVGAWGIMGLTAGDSTV
ncbi:uncharacterized protein AB675_4032 [Cyphellophora attinorum]|jgi:hypothetical protein|uniref:Uncharacterized protein n=1 Tax=Cyphellophora attinorum TaxID=1664694 RepID=A0A0N1HL37_9EURO|nr:uncharacterized protein AB675_4032 [Phialophora attinorum]KPI37614.1 hypothetical protein AB675_4032 [Phialophora attinorum]